VEGARPRDLERVVRTSIECNGGWAGTAIGGFTVGDLRDHAMPGTLARALAVGRASADAVHTDPATLADAVGGRLLATGRVVEARHETSAPGVVSFEVQGDDGAVLRLVARSELIALVRNGVVVAATPTIIAALDATTMAVLEVDEVAVGKDLVLLALPAPPWWLAEPHRRRQAEAVQWGIAGLEETG
ncbi:MAG: S-methyl thiohydantoin desulfurase domain-containing protein, partial [Intrasporangium sp.]|uniref:S-methyl thiohydantoin desulfurase domain-containing protein n=1 Tax=Intrasporangium sp. TaxID=1925024 RepID=UPI003F8125FB